ncbi:E4 SUMO-protein ligase PIAL2-like isoform X2 [Nicotiana sylvestris]|uniref:E3 SUMO-protein ligase PIAS2-like isoform X2 n=1 Tax=Nicotiana sylvestris TaxID=4096 RepID=A0A1U7WTT4_NICSY|nr:PREDICTED: E3 SUMO-protein ligase PIAS2-like isoform X2 [Nicotiana sylvestris]
MTVNSVPAAGVDVGVDRLAMHVFSQPKIDPQQFIQLCLSLARGIDYAIAKQEVPNNAQDLPLLVKQHLLLAVIWCCDMYISWLSSTVRLEILSTTENGSDNLFPRSQAWIWCFVNDFQITKNTNLSKGEKAILLVKVKLVADKFTIVDSVIEVNPSDNSDCRSFHLCSFLLNGTAVGKRNIELMDPGPQLPTPVSQMLKFGTNLLQAVGQFNGNYVIAVAFMREISTPVEATLPDYEQPPVSSVDPDSEIIEGPSRISLNCPISFRRIKIPVKGHSCKYLQCFDFENYVDINSRRPSWRCPHCNQHVCFTDIRIDQDMFKVLKEVGDDVIDVMISSDGSWKAIMESDDHTEKPKDKPLTLLKIVHSEVLMGFQMSTVMF